MTTAVTFEEKTSRVLEVLNSCDSQPGEALVVLVEAALSVLASIRCPDCRKTAIDGVQGLFTDMVAEALRAPSERDHVH